MARALSTANGSCPCPVILVPPVARDLQGDLAEGGSGEHRDRTVLGDRHGGAVGPGEQVEFGVQRTEDYRGQAAGNDGGHSPGLPLTLACRMLSRDCCSASTSSSLRRRSACTGASGEMPLTACSSS